MQGVDGEEAVALVYKPVFFDAILLVVPELDDGIVGAITFADDFDDEVRRSVDVVVFDDVESGLRYKARSRA